MSEFNIDSFLEDLENDVPVSGTDRINKLLMNTRGNQGSIEFLPFMSEKYSTFYSKLSGVREFRCPTHLLDTDNEIWHKILSLEDYGELSKEEIELYNEVSGLFDTLYDSETYSWDTIRLRNYTLFYGFVTNHTNTSGDAVEDSIGKPALLIYPSHSVIESFSVAVKSKITSARGSKSWISSVLSPNSKGRKGSIIINFKKPDGPGYSSSVSIELNSEFNQVVNPERDFSDVLEFFKDPIRDFLGWQGGSNGELFNVEYFKDLRDTLKLEVNSIGKSEEPEVALENKNSDVDPMKTKKAPF